MVERIRVQGHQANLPYQDITVEQLAPGQPAATLSDLTPALASMLTQASSKRALYSFMRILSAMVSVLDTGWMSLKRHPAECEAERIESGESKGRD